MITPEGISGVAFGTASDGDPRVDQVARKAVSDALSIPLEWAWVRQVHGTEVIRASQGGVLGAGDGLFTTQPGLPVAVSVADCLPIALVADGAVGVAHAGWRGVVADVTGATYRAMSRTGHRPHTAVIGPGIGPCCFEVGPEVAERFQGHEATTTWGTVSVDLPAAVEEGIAGLRVISAWACTHHDDRFHSFRADGTSERQFGVAWIAPD